MTDDTWTRVDRYFADLLRLTDPALEAALASSAAAGLPPINVSPSQGRMLMLLARMQRARAILEIGTLGGYSTIWLARGLTSGGYLTTLEADPAHAAVARRNIARAGLASVVDVREGRALETLPDLLVEGQTRFDLIFIDADKPSYPDYLTWALQLSRPGTVIVADNVVRKGAVADPKSADPAVRGVQRFNQQLASDPRLTATAIQTVGSKGYDGFVLAVVVGEP